MAKGYARLTWNGDKVRDKVELAVVRGMLVTMSDCVQTSKELCPVAYGTLQGSLELRAPERRGSKIVGIWGSFNVKYAIFVELGTGPHFPPLDPIRDWARQVLGDEGAAYPVALKISKTGTKAQPYLRPSADEHYPELAKNIRKHA